jgi:dCTP deaminase
MILSDVDIQKEISKKRLHISPFNKKNIQPASYDVTLGKEFRIFKNTQKAYLDVKEDFSNYMELVKIPKDKSLIIHPGEFLLGTTIEKFKIPDDLVGQLNGRSSLGRLGIIIHATAGFIDPGFEGDVTLEMTNMANIPISLYPGMRVGQIAFLRLSSLPKSHMAKEEAANTQAKKAQQQAEFGGIFR